MGYKKNVTKRIRNYKSQTSYRYFCNIKCCKWVINFLRFYKYDFNVALDIIKNIKDQSLVDKKQEITFWLEKIFIYPETLIQLKKLDLSQKLKLIGIGMESVPKWYEFVFKLLQKNIEIL